VILGLSILNTLVVVFVASLWRTAEFRARIGIVFICVVCLLNLIGWRSLS
jgi:hypothetical protein